MPRVLSSHPGLLRPGCYYTPLARPAPVQQMVMPVWLRQTCIGGIGKLRWSGYR